MRRVQLVTLGFGLAFVAAGALILVGCRTGGGPPGAVTVRPGPERAAPRPMARPVRGVWVTRFDYRYPGDVRTIIRHCAELGFNTVFWQVRGAGTVAYPSKLEPWLPEFGFSDPGFDPLGMAVAEAHREGLRVEAWVNVLTGWRGEKPPPVAGQLWNSQPGWFIQDAAGYRQSLGDRYLVLNPCLPEVRQHIVRVIDEIVSRYDVDGVHLDYVRYAWDGERNAIQKYPRDRRTLALYERETGRQPEDDALAWKNWRMNQVTRLVADIRAMLNRRRPGATLTAAVGRNPQTAYNEYLQNSVAWLRAGLVDALMPMAYTEKSGQFEADIAAYRQIVGPRRIVPGVGIYQQKSADVMRAQLSDCAGWGGDFAAFAYASLHPTHQDRAKKGGPTALEQEQRGMRRAVVAEFTGR